MRVINFAETNSVLNQYMAEIRDVQVQSDRMRFRRNIERIGEIMAYEMSKELAYSEKQVQTPLGIAPVSTFDDDVVIATVFRAGLPLHAGFLNVFDRADNAFVSAYRYYKDKECRTVDVHIEYIATPDLTGKTLLLVDPMLATGESSLPGRLSSPKVRLLNCRLLVLLPAGKGWSICRICFPVMRSLYGAVPLIRR